MAGNQQNKTLLDWLDLIIKAIGAFAIPVSIIALLIGVWQFNTQQNYDNQRTLEQSQAEFRNLKDQQQQTTLETYLDRMSELLFTQHLATSQPGGEASQAARARTLTALQVLDPARKRIVLQFLYYSALINRNPPPIVNLNGADLRNVDLSGINLINADLAFVDLSGATLKYANLSEAYLAGANLSNAKLIGTDLTKAKLYNYNPFNLQNKNEFADLSRADLSKANLSRADLLLVNLQNAKLYGANLSKAILWGVNGIAAQELKKQAKSYEGAIMPDLKSTDLQGKDLSDYDLNGINLHAFNLSGTKLIRANLSGADLSYANLSGADLSSADLSYANLYRAEVMKAQWEKARLLKGATMPDGSINP